MVNIVVRQDFGLEFLAKAKPLRPRPRTNITAYDTPPSHLSVLLLSCAYKLPCETYPHNKNVHPSL